MKNIDVVEEFRIIMQSVNKLRSLESKELNAIIKSFSVNTDYIENPYILNDCNDVLIAYEPDQVINEDNEENLIIFDIAERLDFNGLVFLLWDTSRKSEWYVIKECNQQK